MLIPNRHGNSNSYRYGFQGQEKDDELKGEGNSLNYEYRMHDPRVGRFFAVDPLTHQYPWYTPYQFSGNKVIAYCELEGLEEAYRVVPLQTNKPVFRTDSNVSVLDRVGNALSNSVNFLANNTAGVVINTSADVAEIITGQKTVRLYEDIINPIKEFIHESNKTHERRSLSQELDNVIETFSTLENYGVAFQIAVFHKATNLPSATSLSSGTVATEGLAVATELTSVEVTATYTSLSMDAVQLSMRGSIQKALGKTKGVYKFTMTDGTIYVGKAEGANGFAQRVKRSLTELVDGTTSKPAKTEGKTVSKVDFYPYDSAIDASINAQETRILELNGGLESTNTLNKISPPKTSGKTTSTNN